MSHIPQHGAVCHRQPCHISPNTVQFAIPFPSGRETEWQRTRLHLKLWFIEFSNKKSQHSWLTVTMSDANLSPVLLNHYCFLKNFFIISFFFFRYTRISSFSAICLVTNHSHLGAVLLGKGHVIFLQSVFRIPNTRFLCLHPMNFPHHPLSCYTSLHDRDCAISLET